MASLFDRIAGSIEGSEARSAVRVSVADPRSDDCRRSVLISRHRVTIDRSFRGVAMRLSVPVTAYLGVCVGVTSTKTGGFCYELSLTHPDPELSITLAQAPDDCDIWADWRSWANFFGVPTLVERNDGPEVWTPYPGQAAALPKRRVRHRRRRPGIIARRLARPAATCEIHREQELIARH